MDIRSKYKQLITETINLTINESAVDDTTRAARLRSATETHEYFQKALGSGKILLVRSRHQPIFPGPNEEDTATDVKLLVHQGVPMIIDERNIGRAIHTMAPGDNGHISIHTREKNGRKGRTFYIHGGHGAIGNAIEFDSDTTPYRVRNLNGKHQFTGLPDLSEEYNQESIVCGYINKLDEAIKLRQKPVEPRPEIKIQAERVPDPSGPLGILNPERPRSGVFIGGRAIKALKDAAKAALVGAGIFGGMMAYDNLGKEIQKSSEARDQAAEVEAEVAKVDRAEAEKFRRKDAQRIRDLEARDPNRKTPHIGLDGSIEWVTPDEQRTLKEGIKEKLRTGVLGVLAGAAAMGGGYLAKDKPNMPQRTAITQPAANIGSGKVAAKTAQAAKITPHELELAGKFIRQREAFRPQAYDLGDGKITIGYGTTQYSSGKPVKMGHTISKEDAEREHDAYVNREIMPQMQKTKFWSGLDPHQRAAVVSFSYNHGAYWHTKPEYQPLVSALMTPDNHKMVSDAWYKYAHSKKNPKLDKGLRNRAEQELQLFAGGSV